MNHYIIKMTKICNIRRATLNGRAVKLFEVRQLVGGAWVFAGQHSAPARTANRDLLQFAAI